MRYWLIILLCLLGTGLAGCAEPAPAAQASLSTVPPTAQVKLVEPTANPSPPATQEASPVPATGTVPVFVTETPLISTEQPTGLPTLAPEAWRNLPVIPESLDPRVAAIYQRGLELGNNPQAFSKVGDCGATPAWFLGDFDRGPRFYRLGDYTTLQSTIEYYSGSYGRTSLAGKEGFNAASVFTQLWADRSQCLSGETPIACEYRIQRPSLAFVMLGTNDVWHKDSFEPQMRKIIEFSIENGVIPILSTKADDRERDGSLNATVARLSVEYGVPLWNYWAAVQSLPNAGLQEDGAHITWAPNRFDDPRAMQKGWPVRNLTALQMLDLLRNSLGGE